MHCLSVSLGVLPLVMAGVQVSCDVPDNTYRTCIYSLGHICIPCGVQNNHRGTHGTGKNLKTHLLYYEMFTPFTIIVLVLQQLFFFKLLQQYNVQPYSSILHLLAPLIHNNCTSIVIENSVYNTQSPRPNHSCCVGYTIIEFSPQ